MALRTCVVCRVVGEKGALVRFTLKDGAIGAQRDGAADKGRGAYVCPAEKCFMAAAGKRRAFEAALKAKAEVPDTEGFLAILKEWRKNRENG